MAVYYNEWEPYAAQWLRNLIKAGHLPEGDVDERDIRTIAASDLQGYSQCHFFAGIGGWALALKFALWDDTRPVWTGSCPCQPFSSAGRQEGHGDERHLWPHWRRLIRESRPATIFGEQVAGAIAFGWIDEVFNDLEAEAYTCGAAVLPACSVGAPHRRDRLWFVARDSKSSGKTEIRGLRGGKNTITDRVCETLSDSGQERCEYGGDNRERGSILHNINGNAEKGESQREGWKRGTGTLSPDVANPMREGRGLQQIGSSECENTPNPANDGKTQSLVDTASQRSSGSWESQQSLWPKETENRQAAITEPSSRSGFWAVEPGMGRVANGVPARVGRLCTLGNAIVPQVAAEFIKATM
jgi:DNA (cytosine-5)-methyltransferase 1